MQKAAKRGVIHGSILLFRKYYSNKSGGVLDCGSWTETELMKRILMVNKTGPKVTMRMSKIKH